MEMASLILGQDVFGWEAFLMLWTCPTGYKFIHTMADMERLIIGGCENEGRKLS